MNRAILLSAATGIAALSFACFQSGDKLPHPGLPSPVHAGFAFGLTQDSTKDFPRPQDEVTEEEIAIDTITTVAGSTFVVEKSSGIDKRFEPVMQRLIKAGWSEDFVAQRFKDKRMVFIPKMTLVKARSGSTGSTGSSAYAWMDTRESADACKEFLAKYREIMDQAEERYGVDRETIAALMRCETRHGAVTGDYHVFSVYASMALMTEPRFLNESLEKAEETMKGRKAGKAKTDAELEWIRARAQSRSKWAYKELVNLLKIDREGHAEAMSLYGSWAGAFGWSQFLPSSYLRRAVDGNGDNKIDLFDPHDAINSVANYLSKSGYKIGNDGSRRKAIRSYNNSTAYVNSIIDLSERVRKETASR